MIHAFTFLVFEVISGYVIMYIFLTRSFFFAILLNFSHGYV